MCGIAGMFSYTGAPLGKGHEDELARVSRALRRRGPDAEGSFVAPDRSLLLAHRRLSIIDLSERGAQPMALPDGSAVITFNGEIYNYRELREGLQARGAHLVSESDTEVLLHLYRERGDQMVHALRGMFAFAIWDRERGGVFMARDPYGIKPLYFADDGRCLRFASQVKALVAGGMLSRALDPAGLCGFYLLGSVPEPFTIYRSIEALPAGATVWIDARGVREPTRYFSLAAAFERAAEQRAGVPDDEAHVLPRLREALRDSVTHHLVADVPVGAFLSSGIDSGALVALMAETSPHTIQSVTIRFPEFAQRAEDEAPLAAQLAQRLGVAHRVRDVTHSELDAALPRILDAMDQPSIDGINTWLASLAAHEMGLKVVVSGLGGDELWGGYPSFRDLPRIVRAGRLGQTMPGLGRSARRIARPLLERTHKSPKLAGLLELGGDLPGAYLLRRGLFMPWELDELLPRGMRETGLSRLRPLSHIGSQLDVDTGTDFGRVAVLESSLYMRNQLLRDSDWASMDHSLELRVPLVDAQLLSRVAPLLLGLPAGAGKQLLSRCPTPPLPDEVAHRPKTGFSTPIAAWLKQSPELESWRAVPALARPGCHWSRRMAHAIVTRWSS